MYEPIQTFLPGRCRFCAEPHDKEPEKQWSMIKFWQCTLAIPMLAMSLSAPVGLMAPWQIDNEWGCKLEAHKFLTVLTCLWLLIREDGSLGGRGRKKGNHKGREIGRNGLGIWSREVGDELSKCDWLLASKSLEAIYHLVAMDTRVYYGIWHIWHQLRVISSMDFSSNFYKYVIIAKHLSAAAGQPCLQLSELLTNRSRKGATPLQPR